MNKFQHLTAENEVVPLYVLRQQEKINYHREIFIQYLQLIRAVHGRESQ
jgi:hypothetical protein